MYTHEISDMYFMEIPVCVTYECYKQDLIPGWIVVRLQNGEWMNICWLKYRCLNQRWLFFSILCELYLVNPECSQQKYHDIYKYMYWGQLLVSSLEYSRCLGPTGSRRQTSSYPVLALCVVFRGITLVLRPIHFNPIEYLAQPSVLIIHHV